jgi:flagellar biosynthetic protein FliP
MTRRLRHVALGAVLLGALVLHAAHAAPAIGLSGIDISLDAGTQRHQVSMALQILATLTLLSLAPSILISMTSFVRIVIVLSMLRHAFGMQETPPNAVLVSLALFLTLFTMSPVLERVQHDAIKPYMDKKLELDAALDKGIAPIKDFMIRQTREKDIALMADIAHESPPTKVEDVKLLQLVPAFMLNELCTAFKIGFVIFLPFLLIDLVVSSILMALGMMMVPPMTISLPLKILMFVLIDGWNLVARSLVHSFH